MDRIQELAAKISQRTATAQEVAEYRNLIAQQNSLMGRNFFDPNFGSSMFSQTDPAAAMTGPQGPEAARYQNFFAQDNNQNQIPDYLQMAQSQNGSGEMEDLSEDEPFQNQLPGFPFITGGGSDISTELYSLGRAIGAPKGSRGRMLTGIASAGAAAFDIARNVASGIGFEKRNQYMRDWYANQQRQTNYTAAPQYQNTNTVGGITMEEGGELFNQEMAPLQQAGQGDQMRQMAAFVMDMLQDGEQPEQIIDNLIGQGVPEMQAQQIVSVVVQQMSGGQQASPQEPANASQEPTMAKGGGFTKQPGDKITFMHGGKKHSGTIKEIKNGEIVLK